MEMTNVCRDGKPFSFDPQKMKTKKQNRDEESRRTGWTRLPFVKCKAIVTV